MKKTIAFLLAMLMLCGCQSAGEGAKTTAPRMQLVQGAQTHTDYAGIEIQIAEATWGADGLTLQVDWKNRTPHEATFGAAYTIERKEGEEWVSCQTVDDLVFIAIGYILSPGQTRREVYQVSTMFDVTKAGTYRFRADFSVEDLSHQNLWAEFVLGSHGDHIHRPAPEPQTAQETISGYCGNIQTTLYIGDKEYTFMYGHSVTLTDILANLDYDPMKVCRCRPEYWVDTEFASGYGINLRSGYARCEMGQADLTQEQIDTIGQIIQWAETTNCTYTTDGY